MGRVWSRAMRRLCFLCLACGLMYTSVPDIAHASSVSNASFNTLIRKAVKARKSGNLEQASELLRQAIALNSMPELLNNLGMVYTELGRYDDAVDMYRKVVDHPDAKDDLKRLDAERIELLEPKLRRAWLSLESKHKSLQVFIDRRVKNWKRKTELEAPPGSCVLQVTSDDGSRTQLEFLDLPAGRRTSVNLSLEQRPRRLGRVLWSPPETPVTEIRIGDYKVAGDVSLLSGIHLQPGSYTIRIRQRGRQSVTQELRVGAGEATELSEVMGGAPIGSDPAVDDRSGPPSLPTLPLVTIGVGVALSGIGGALLHGAHGDRALVREAQGPDGVMTISMAEAVELETSANDQASNGAVLVGLGVAATVTGLVWWWTTGSEGSASQGLWLAPAHDGLAVGGRF